MSKFIIKYKIIDRKTLTGEEEKEFNTPEEALQALSENTLQIREEYVNGMSIISRDDLQEMIDHKMLNEQEKLKQKEEK